MREQEALERDRTTEHRTLRDYFAGQALTAIISGDSHESYEAIAKTGGEIAAACYAVADAMLAAREATSD